jgi:MFS family permease
MQFWSVGRALASRNFRLYFIGQCISLIGTWMQQVAMIWLVYRLTGSAYLLGVVGFSTQIPAFFLSPVAGVFVDRWNRHHALLATQSLAMLQATLLVTLTATGIIQIWHVITIGLLFGIITAFDMPLRQAFLTEMVTNRDDLANAIALNSSIFNGARLVGPSLAGFLVAWSGEWLCFLIDALSYLAVLVALLLMRDLPQRPVPSSHHIFRGLREGFAYAFGFAPIRTLLMLSLVSLSAMPLTVLMPVVDSQILHGGPATLGFLMAASGAGALIGALYLAARRSVLGLGRHIVFGAAFFGLSVIAFSFSRILWLSLCCLAVSGFCLMLEMAASNTLLQTIVDEDKRGRVMSLYTTAFLGSAPIGSYLAGILADHVGAPLTLRIAGLVCIAAAVFFGWRLPHLRELVRPIYLNRGILPAAPLPAVEATAASVNYSGTDQ